MTKVVELILGNMHFYLIAMARLGTSIYETCLIASLETVACLGGEKGDAVGTGSKLAFKKHFAFE